jgi:hypothetical protein
VKASGLNRALASTVGKIPGLGAHSKFFLDLNSHMPLTVELTDPLTMTRQVLPFVVLKSPKRI